MSSPEGSTVTFRRIPADSRAARAIERFARKLQDEVAKGRPFDCLITGDAELRRLNREFRGKDYAPTSSRFRRRRPGVQAAGPSATSPSRWRAPAPRRANSATPSNRKSAS